MLSATPLDQRCTQYGPTPTPVPHSAHE